MKRTWKILATFAAFAGIFLAIIYFLWIPQKTAAYPDDLTVQEYGENLSKNADVMIASLEKINKPTLRETLAEYQKVAPQKPLYPSYLHTLEQVEDLYKLEYHLCEESSFLEKWRYGFFMKKYYPNLCSFNRKLRKELDKAVKNGSMITPYDHEVYTYKDGSLITFSGGSYSVTYHDKKNA